jgi:glycosyltransferase involved in cell wall biosynthesis
MNPLVSIILPTYKNADRITLSIESVLKQDYSKWELIIIDDGLYDIPKEKIIHFTKKDPRIIYIGNRESTGIQKALNHGLSIAKGDLIARIDDDDEWVDFNKLTKQVRFLKDNDGYVLVGTNAIICDENGKELDKHILPDDNELIRARMLMKNCFIHSSIMVRKDAILQVGGYSENESIKHIEDYELWLRIGRAGKVANINTFSVRLTSHPNSLTFKNRIIQAKKAIMITQKFRKYYPNFLAGQMILRIRVIVILIITHIPIPKTLFYSIQRVYKKL